MSLLVNIKVRHKMLHNTGVTIHMGKPVGSRFGKMVIWYEIWHVPFTRMFAVGSHLALRVFLKVLRSSSLLKN